MVSACGRPRWSLAFILVLSCAGAVATWRMGLDTWTKIIMVVWIVPQFLGLGLLSFQMAELHGAEAGWDLKFPGCTLLGWCCFCFPSLNIQLMGKLVAYYGLWFGMLGVLLSNNPFQKMILGIQTTNLPNKLKHEKHVSRSSLGFWYFSPFEKRMSRSEQNDFFSFLAIQKMNEWKPWKGTISKESRLPTSIFHGICFCFQGSMCPSFCL